MKDLELWTIAIGGLFMAGTLLVRFLLDYLDDRSLD